MKTQLDIKQVLAQLGLDFDKYNAERNERKVPVPTFSHPPELKEDSDSRGTSD